MSWTVPRMWAGETVAVIATGPSLTQAQCDAVRGLRTIAVNDAYLLAPWADMLYAADSQWWQLNVPYVKDFKGIRVCAQPNSIAGVHWIRNSGNAGFDPDPQYVRTGNNSGYQAIHVAIHAGAERVLLLGFDAHGTHFFGAHRHPLTNTTPESYARRIPKFAGLIGHGAEIVNCTPGSAIDCYPRMSLEEALAEVTI